MCDIINLAADNAPGIEPKVPIVLAVLNGDEGGWHIFGQAIEIYRRRKLASTNADQGARPVEVGYGGLAFDVVEPRGVRQINCKHGEEGSQEDKAPDAEKGDPVEECL